MRRLAWFAALAICAVAQPAAAEVPVMETVKCPLTGQNFQHMGYAAYSRFGQALDGQPYGSTQFPLRMPECPGSKLPVYREFTPAEVERLKAFVTSAEFVAAGDSVPWFRMYLTEKFLGEDRGNYAYAALSASWQAKGTASYGRYAEVALRELDAWVATLAPTEERWWGTQLQLANLERQTGNFTGAKARLDRVDAAPGDPPAILADWFAETRRLAEAGDRASYVWNNFEKKFVRG